MKSKHFQSHMILLLSLSLLTCILCSACSSSQAQVSKSGFYFDTIITITLYGTEDDELIEDCFDLAERYENLFSSTVEDSDVSRINAAGGEFVTVDDETIALIELGIYYGGLSDGKFDITIGTLSDLWNLSELAETSDGEENEADASVLPSDEEIQEALSHVDYQNVEIEGNQVRLADAEAKLDLGGIAKGYIADRMKEYLVENGVTSAIINLGGNVLTVGAKTGSSTSLTGNSTTITGTDSATNSAADKNSSPFRIGIQKPFDTEGELITTLEITDQSVVTSGIYERYITVDGQIYHHILDTDTGYPYDNGLYSVTIISDSSADGDALSTTCLALGLTDGMELVESLEGVEAVFVTDEYEVVESSGL